MPHSAQAEGATYFRHCPKFKHLGPKDDGTRFSAFLVTCGKARRILKPYLESGSHAPKRIKGFPEWECDSGKYAGSCTNTQDPEKPEIYFEYLWWKHRPY